MHLKLLTKGHLLYKNKRVFKRYSNHGGEISNHPYMSGLIVRKEKDWIVVSTLDENFLIIKSVLNEKGKNIISKTKVGNRFITSSGDILKSKKV